MTQAPANLETVARIELLLAERLEQIGGCGDGDCKVHRRGGQHTNGGCRCLRHDGMKAERVVGAYRTFRAAILALHDAAQPKEPT